jgi:hypothetical protein
MWPDNCEGVSLFKPPVVRRAKSRITILPTPKFDDIVKLATDKGAKVKVVRENVTNSKYALMKCTGTLKDGTVLVWSELSRSGNELIRPNSEKFRELGVDELPHKHSLIY